MVESSAPFGWCYASTQVLDASAAIAPLAAPDAPVRVSDLFP